MAGYDDTYQMIISTLMGRPVGTEIQPDSQQAYEINMLNYIRSLELIANGPLIGIAEANTQPIQPNDARACYIAGVAQDRTVTFQNFRNYLGQPIQITNGQMEACLVILIWDTQYWSATQVPTNIISAAEQANFYYNFNVRKTYPSVAAMNADKDNPIGTDGKYINVGDIVSVVNNNNSSENGFYSRIEGGWQFQTGFNFELSQTKGTNPNIGMSQKIITDIVDYSGLGATIKTLFGGINKTPQNWMAGFVNPSGVYNISHGYRSSDFIPVIPGQTYYAVVSGSNGTLVVSGYSSNSQDSFVAGSSVNIIGNASNTIMATLRVITIPTGINYIRIGANAKTPNDAVGLILKEKTGMYDDNQELHTDRPILINQTAVIKDKQLVVSSDFIAGGFMMISTGLVSANKAYLYTDFIPVIPGQTYKVVGGASNNGGCCFYDIDKVYHNNYVQGNNPTFIIPENCYYMRLSAHISATNPSATLQDDTYKSNKELKDEISNLEPHEKLINSALNDVFVTEGSADTLDNIYSGTTTRRRIYDAIKNIKFYGLDETKKHTLYVLWNRRWDNNFFSLRITEYNQSTNAWVVVLQLTAEQVAAINAPLGTETVSVKITGSGAYANAYCIVDIDLSLVPQRISTVFNDLTATPEYIFSKNCYYKNTDTPTPPTVTTYVPKTIRLFPNTKLPVISFQFDDIPTNDEQVVSLFDEYGLTCGFAFIASTGNMTSKAAKYYEWQKRGYQILNHSINGTIFNTTNYTYETALATIMQAKNTLEKYGFVVNGWVSPSSQMADEFMPIIKLAHAYAATKNDAYVNGRQSNPCSLTRYSIESNTLANIKTQVDSYISNDKALTFYGHAASFGTEYNGEVWNIDKIRSIIEYCISKRDAGLCYLSGCDDAMKYYFDL